MTSRHFNIQTWIILDTHGFEGLNFDVTMNSLVCLTVICAVLAVNIQAFQHNRQIGDLRLKFDNGFPEEYCLELDTNEEWKINSNKTLDCFHCKCSSANAGIRCTGIGYQDGIVPPAGCMKRHLQAFEMSEGETCCYQFVNKDNLGETCGEKVCG
ncbi:hypothetical protein LOTGIDRAFT_237131 [Lottia gigantea]|uniref:Uncharacterized protein n=1 Tax=Lottia gigantea TaxID=225164 RepID=V4B1M1_LOTGI|nr:hypothetical protein LOTGIDRAFT_237131 [Lottia gigantea]ESO82144.1 hypothetical protein LOTGIDRAFT_237131 [Lottia gigantea]